MAISNFPTEIVLKACKAFTANREAIVAANREHLIGRLMNRHFFAVKTRDKAIETLKKAGSGIFNLSKWDVEDWTAAALQGRVDHITELAKAAFKSAIKEISLSDKDIIALSPYLFAQTKPRTVRIILTPRRELSKEEIGMAREVVDEALAEYYETRALIHYGRGAELPRELTKEETTCMNLAEALRTGEITIEATET